MDILKQLVSFYLFEGLAQHEINAFINYCKILDVKPGQLITEEGDKPDQLFFIVEGSFEVSKKDPITGLQYAIIKLFVGDTVGEIALIDLKPRSGTVRAVEPGKLYAISIADVHRFAADYHDAYARILKNISKEVSKRLRYTNEVILGSFIVRDKIENFLILTIVTLCFYAFTLRLIPELVSNFEVSHYPALFLFTVTLFPILYIIKSKHYSVLEIINLKNWKKFTVEAILYTLPILLLIVLLKLAVINIRPTLHNYPLFSGSLVTFLTPLKSFLLMFLYIISCPVQEFIIRGILQGSLATFLQGKSVVLRSIIISNVIYSTMHLYLTFSYTVVALVLGLFFGWLYAKQKSLVGVTISHALIGIWAIYIVGIEYVLF